MYASYIQSASLQTPRLARLLHVVVIFYVICWHLCCLTGAARQTWSIVEHWTGPGTGTLPNSDVFEDGAPTPAAETASTGSALGQPRTILAWAAPNPLAPAVAQPALFNSGGVSVAVAQVSVALTPRCLRVFYPGDSGP